MDSSSSSPTPPPLPSRPSNLSFTSLSPSDSRSNYRPVHSNRRPLKNSPLKHHNLRQATLSNHQEVSSQANLKQIIPLGTRPDEIEILSIEDPDDLFQSFTVREVKVIEQRARLDADKKQEELRQMVGERYRDLLGAADSIVRMKNSTEKLLQKLDQASLECDKEQLKSRALKIENHHLQAVSASSRLSYILATLVKLLMDLFEYIWRSLERDDFLLASRYEALGRVISNELMSPSWDGSGQIKPGQVLEFFPIVKRQTEMLSQLGPQISARAKSFLRQWETKDHETMRALAAVALLDNTNLLDSLQLLLHARKTALNALMSRIHGLWIDQIKSAIKLIVSTLAHIEQIFASNELVKLLQTIQQGSSEEKHCNPILSSLPNAHQLIRHIPRSIIEFSPFVAALVEPQTPEPYSHTQTWFHQCQEQLIGYIDSHLNQVRGIETLVELRQKILEAFGQPSGELKSSIGIFRQKVLNSLNRRFKESYQDRLDRLKVEIIQNINNYKYDQYNRKNCILQKRLPPLENNNPMKFSKYLESIRNRIEGKLAFENEGINKGQEVSTLIGQMENIGKLMREDFEIWRRTDQNDAHEISEHESQRKEMLKLAKNFIENCLDEINRVLDHEVEQRNIERQLTIGELALQILLTRNSFMKDLSSTLIDQSNICKTGENDERTKRVEELIERLETGLNEVISKSLSQWIQIKIQKSISMFELESLEVFQNPKRHPTIEVKQLQPTGPMYKSIQLISDSMLNFRIHLIKSKQLMIASKLVGGLVEGVLNTLKQSHLSDSGNNIDHTKEAKDQQTVDQGKKCSEYGLLFDLVCLKVICSRIGNLEALISKINEHIDCYDSTNIESTSFEVIKFLNRIERIWWPILLIHHDSAIQKQKDNTDNDRLTQTNQKNHVRMGIECVKPGNRFGLLSIF